MYLQTPKRPNLPATPASSAYLNHRPSLPPLSSLLPKDVSVPLSSYSASGKPRLPSIDTFNTPPASAFPSHSYFKGTPCKTVTFNNSYLDDDSINDSVNDSINESVNNSINDSINDSVNVSIDSIADSDIEKPTKKRKLTDSKAFAFISHSPATFPSQEPAIDNAPLARRKRRRTSPHELNILQKEFLLGSTPNKSRRLEIAAKVNMTEKAVQIWFQNKRQSLRKQSNHDKDVTELPPTPDTSLVMYHQLAPPPLPQPQLHQHLPPQPLPQSLPQPLPQPMMASTPTKPVLHRFQSQPYLTPAHSTTTPKIRSSSTSNLHETNTPPQSTPSSHASPVLIDAIDTSSILPPHRQSLVLNATNKKQPLGLNSLNSSTMTFKLGPAKIATASSTPTDSSVMNKLRDEMMGKPHKRTPLSEITNTTPANGGKKKNDSECVENLLSLRSGQWK